MQIDVGYFYFIKDSFFDIMDDPELMKNKESGNKRPCYYCIKSKKYDNIIWFIPVSTKIEKYKKVYDSKIQKQIKLGKNPSVNKTFRPGRLLYVDGKRVYDGKIKQECFAKFDVIAEKFYENSSRINMDIPTIPYR